MQCSIPLAPHTAKAVANWAGVYSLSSGAFFRTTLRFAEVVMHRLRTATNRNNDSQSSVDAATTSQERQELSKQPSDFPADFYVGMLPTLGKRSEFRRVAALLAEATARLHSQRKHVHSTLGKRGHDLELHAGTKVTREYMPQERTFLREDKQYASLEDLSRLKAVFSQRKPPSDTMDCDADVDLSLMDMALWAPVAQRYGFLPCGIVVRDRMPLEEKNHLLQGLAILIAQITEAICFALSVNLGLPKEDLLNDLLITHDRARKLAIAWDDVLRKYEASVYQIRAHGDVLTDRLLVFAVRATRHQNIFGFRPMSVGGITAVGAYHRIVDFSQEDLDDYK